MSVPMNPRARFLVTTVALIAVAVAWNVLDGPARPAPRRPASAASMLAPRAGLVVPPTATDLLARREALRLTATQRARLEALATEWRRDVAPLEAAASVAMDDFSRYMAETERTGRARLDDVRARSAAVQELSAALRAHRTRHGAAAMAVLTESQKTHMSGGSR